MGVWDEEHARQRAAIDKPRLERLRKIAKKFPETSEHDRFGGVWFKAGKRVFLTFHASGHNPDDDHLWAISFATSRDDQEALCHGDLFYPTPYMHQHGWTSMKADKPDWGLVEELADTAYRRVALGRMLKKLNG